MALIPNPPGPTSAVSSVRTGRGRSPVSLPRLGRGSCRSSSAKSAGYHGSKKPFPPRHPSLPSHRAQPWRPSSARHPASPWVRVRHPHRVASGIPIGSASGIPIGSASGIPSGQHLASPSGPRHHHIRTRGPPQRSIRSLIHISLLLPPSSPANPRSLLQTPLHTKPFILPVTIRCLPMRRGCPLRPLRLRASLLQRFILNLVKSLRKIIRPIGEIIAIPPIHHTISWSGYTLAVSGVYVVNKKPDIPPASALPTK